MALLAVVGATVSCMFGAAPSKIVAVTSQAKDLIEGKPIMTIKDNGANTNILPFGMCSSLANPTVASATAAALGVLTPQPCQPVFPAPWIPGGKPLMCCNIPAVDQTSKLMCLYAGLVSIADPGQTKRST